jgi:ParB family transcriptional regulator, chromosome partitioning protein
MICPSAIPVQRQIIRDCLAGANGRAKVEHWLPRWMAFPPASYTDREGFRPVEEWNRVADLFA